MPKLVDERAFEHRALYRLRRGLRADGNVAGMAFTLYRPGRAGAGLPRHHPHAARQCEAGAGRHPSGDPAGIQAACGQGGGRDGGKFGFASHYSYVARVGRGRQIELFFIVPKNWPARRLEEWDAIRDEIGEALGGEGSDRWLTIVFTTDEEWAV